LPEHAFAYLELPSTLNVEATDLLSGRQTVLSLSAGATIDLTLPPLSAVMWKFII